MRTRHLALLVAAVVRWSRATEAPENGVATRLPETSVVGEPVALTADPLFPVLASIALTPTMHPKATITPVMTPEPTREADPTTRQAKNQAEPTLGSAQGLGEAAHELTSKPSEIPLLSDIRSAPAENESSAPAPTPTQDQSTEVSTVSPPQHIASQDPSSTEPSTFAATSDELSMTAAAGTKLPVPTPTTRPLPQTPPSVTTQPTTNEFLISLPTGTSDPTSTPVVMTQASGSGRISNESVVSSEPRASEAPLPELSTTLPPSQYESPSPNPTKPQLTSLNAGRAEGRAVEDPSATEKYASTTLVDSAPALASEENSGQLITSVLVSSSSSSEQPLHRATIDSSPKPTEELEMIRGEFDYNATADHIDTNAKDTPTETPSIKSTAISSVEEPPEVYNSLEVASPPNLASPSPKAPVAQPENEVPETLLSSMKDSKMELPSPTPVPLDLTSASVPQTTQPETTSSTETVSEEPSTSVPESTPHPVPPYQPSFAPVSTQPPDLPPPTQSVISTTASTTVDLAVAAGTLQTLNPEATLIPIATKQADWKGKMSSSGGAIATPMPDQIVSSNSDSLTKDPEMASTQSQPPSEGEASGELAPYSTLSPDNWPPFDRLLPPPPPDSLPDADIAGSTSSGEDPWTAVNKLTSSDSNGAISGDWGVVLVIGLVAGCSVVIGVLLAVEIYLRRARRRHLELCDAQQPIIVL